jgi:hypothetical protein
LLTDHIALGVLSDAFPRELLDEVLAVTGQRKRRVRLLPAHVVIRFVLALSLFFKDSYEEVMRKLVGELVALSSWERVWKVPGQARQRLGAEPVRLLFERAAVPMAVPGTWGAWPAGMRLVVFDGTSLDVADSTENAARFGHWGSGPKASAFPRPTWSQSANAALMPSPVPLWARSVKVNAPWPRAPRSVSRTTCCCWRTPACTPGPCGARPRAVAPACAGASARALSFPRYGH